MTLRPVRHASLRHSSVHDPSSLIHELVDLKEVVIHRAIVRYIDRMRRAHPASAVEALDRATDDASMDVLSKLDRVTVVSGRAEDAILDQDILNVPRDLEAVPLINNSTTSQALVDCAVADAHVSTRLWIDLPYKIRCPLHHEPDSSDPADANVLRVYKL